MFITGFENWIWKGSIFHPLSCKIRFGEVLSLFLSGVEIHSLESLWITSIGVESTCNYSGMHSKVVVLNHSFESGFHYMYF